MKKLLIVCLSFVMVLAMAVPAFAYSDTGNCTTAQKTAIDNLSSLNIVGGYSDGTFNPAGSITRAEFAKIAVQAYIKVTGNSSFTEKSYEFSDLVNGAWYQEWVQKACNAGLLVGYEDKTFRPNAEITGNEVVTVLMRIMGYKDADLTGTWPDNYLAKAKTLGILQNVDIDYGKAISRANVCVLTNNVLNQKTTSADYAVLEKVSGKNLTLLLFNGSEKSYTFAGSNVPAVNKLVSYAAAADNSLSEISTDNIYTNNTKTAAVADSKITLNGKSYALTSNTKVYTVSGADGALTLGKVDVSKIKTAASVTSAATSKLNFDIQYTLNGSDVAMLVIGGYTGVSTTQFGFIEDLGIKSADIDYGVQMYGDTTVYDKRSGSDDTLQKNTLYQYKVTGSKIRLNAVDTAKEQIQNGEITSAADGLYNTTGGTGTQNVFTVTDKTVVMKVEYKNNVVDSVTYNYTPKKGDVVRVRYKIGSEADQEAAYVVVVVQK